jgi:hypothetical protein
MIELDKLQRVSIRKIWEHEAQSFTPWLAKVENILHLGDEINIEFDTESIQTEVRIGDFNVDILAKDISGQKIIIENQLEKTDHDHLGKCITYAAGVGANTILWIAKDAREEHKQAVEWLNANSTEGINLFLIQIEAWQIGDSKPAPKFNIIESPNEWTRVVKTGSMGSKGDKKISDTKLRQQKFWEEVKEFGEEHSRLVRSWRKAVPQHWYDVSIGTSAAHLALIADSRKRKVSIQLYIDDGNKENNKRLFRKIEADKMTLEDKLGKLDWHELGNKRSSIISAGYDKDWQDESERAAAIQWLVEMSDKYIQYFSKYFN